MTDYKIGDKVELSDKAYCGDGIGYINKIDGGAQPYQVTNQRPGTDDEFVWGAYVGADEILRIVPPMTDTNERMNDALDKIRAECGPMKCRLCSDTNTIVVENDVGRRESVECPECSTRQLRTDLAAANERAEKAEAHLYCCPDEINCGRRWEAPDENDGEKCPFCERDTLRTDLAAANERAEKAEAERSRRDDLIDDLTTKLCEAHDFIDTLRTENAAMREALDRAMRHIKANASQMLCNEARAFAKAEFGDESTPDFEGAYDCIVKEARDTLARLTTQEGKSQ